MTKDTHTVASEPSPATFESANDAAGGRAFPWDVAAAAWCVAALTLAAAILRLSLLDSRSLWLDESATAYWTTLPVGSLLKVLAHGEMNMFLYYLLLHGWTSVVGSSESMLRLPSVFFDTAIVPLIYVLAAELRHRRAGVVAALLVTTNATSIHWAQTARSYSMYMTLATVASIFFIRSINDSSEANLAKYIVAGTSSVYTHLFGILALPSQWLSLFLFRSSRKTAIGLTAAMLMIALLSVPAFLFDLAGAAGSLAWVSRTELQSVEELFFVFAGAFDQGANVLTKLLTVLYMVGVALAVVWRRSDEWPAAEYLLLSICVPVALTVAVSFVKPIFVFRYLLAGLPLFALLAAIGFARLKPAFAIAMVIAVVMLSLAEDYTYFRGPSDQDWRGAVDYVATHSQPGDSLIVYPDYYTGPIRYYVLRRAHPETFPTTVFMSVARVKADESQERLAASYGLGNAHRIWFTFPTWEPSGETALQMMLRNMRVIDGPKFAGVRLFLLERTP